MLGADLIVTIMSNQFAIGYVHDCLRAQCYDCLLDQTVLIKSDYVVIHPSMYLAMVTFMT